jgi:hypothetical protein
MAMSRNREQRIIPHGAIAFMLNLAINTEPVEPERSPSMSSGRVSSKQIFRSVLKMDR